MDPHISMITLGVEEMERSVAFYRDGLGLPLADAEGDMAVFDLGTVRLALYPHRALAEDVTVNPLGSGFRGITLAHNVESEARVDAVFAEAVEAGAEPVKEPQEAFWGGYSGYFADPDGHLWEVAYNPFDEE